MGDIMGTRYLALALVFVFTAACSIQKDADKMISTSDEIKNETKHLGKRTDDMENELVGKESPAVEMDKLDQLFSEGQYARTGASSEPDLLKYAGVAVQAMLFQYWKGDYNESLNVLDRRFSMAMEIMFISSTKHIPRTFNVNIFNPDSSYKAIASLGATLDQMRPEYGDNLKLRGLENLSLYDVMIQALQDRGQIERTELLPQATAKVLQWKQETIYIMQLRHNYLPMVVLGRMTDIQDRGDFSRLWGSLAGISVDLSQTDPEQIKLWTKWLNDSLDTRQKLQAMGIQPEYNSMFRNILGNVDFGQRQLVAAPLERLSPLQLLQRKFAEAYYKVLSQK